MELRRAVLLLMLALCSQAAQSLDLVVTPRGAVPIDPITGIIDAFQSHDVVALDEGNHGNEPGHAFRVSLIRDPRFAGLVNDIVVEFGNSLYQDLADRFVNGDEIDPKQLRKIWQDTGLTHTGWDRPIYEQLVREVRLVNASLPQHRRLRVLLGDPPFDWSKVHTREDWMRQKYARTDAFPANLIQREVIDKRRRALVIYGGMHLLRKNLYFAFKDRELAEKAFNEPAETIVGLLERSGTKVFSVWTHSFGDLASLQPEIKNWPTPSLILLRGTHWGHASLSSFYPSNGLRKSLRTPKGPTEMASLDPQRTRMMEELLDAVLYLGPPRDFSYSKLSAELCGDAEYLEMRIKRMTLLPPPMPPRGSSPFDPAATMKRECDRALGQ